MTLNIDVKESNHHRHVNDIFKMIDDSTLPERVKYRSKKIFEIIGQAEAKIHGMSFEEVHFHEVGAMDSIIDIIGGCIALEQLGLTHYTVQLFQQVMVKSILLMAFIQSLHLLLLKFLKVSQSHILMFKVNSQPLLVLHLLRDSFHRLGHFLQQQYNI